tara:strand:- start:425 stop:631 length:207 start_codon:yes stop_codon:yes gene_type:complete
MTLILAAVDGGSTPPASTILRRKEGNVFRTSTGNVFVDILNDNDVLWNVPVRICDSVRCDVYDRKDKS